MELLIRTTISVIVLFFLLLFSRRRKPVLLDGYSDVYTDPYLYNGLLIFFLAALLIIAEGFRHGYADTANYKGGYSYLSDNLVQLLFESSAPGFVFIQWILRRISKNPQFIILFSAVLFTICDFSFIKKYSRDYPFSLLLYYSLSFLSNCNGIRQILAAVLLMLGFHWVIERKYVRYVALILFLSTIHRSILYTIPLLFLYGGKRMNKGIVAFLLVCLFSMFVPSPINALIGRFVEDDYSHYLNTYTAGANIINVFIDAVPFTLSVVYHRANRQNVGENRAIDVLINMYAIRFGFMMLATNMAQYARIGMYMRNCTVILVPFLIDQLFRGESKHLIKATAIILYFVVFVVDCYSQTATGAFIPFYLDFSILFR